jgi:hypothetical protein
LSRQEPLHKYLPILEADPWIDGIEDDLRMLRLRGWRQRALDRREWKNVLETARAQTGL